MPLSPPSSTLIPPPKFHRIMALMGISSPFLSNHLYLVFSEENDIAMQRITNVEQSERFTSPSNSLSRSKFAEFESYMGSSRSFRASDAWNESTHEIFTFVDDDEVQHDMIDDDHNITTNSTVSVSDDDSKSDASREAFGDEDGMNASMTTSQILECTASSDVMHPGLSGAAGNVPSPSASHTTTDSAFHSPISPTLEDDSTGTKHFNKDAPRRSSRVTQHTSNNTSNELTTHDELQEDLSSPLSPNLIDDDAPLLREDQLIEKLNIWKTGAVEDKLRFIFNIFDLKREGKIRKSSVMRILREIYDMLGDVVSRPQDLASSMQDSTLGSNGGSTTTNTEKRMPTELQQLIEKRFDDMDRRKKGFLTFEEYEQVVFETPEIQRALGVDMRYGAMS